MEKIDILNRGQFIEQLVNLVQNIPDNRSSVTFAIDGKWGCGKTFVLDMFEEKLSQIQSEKTATDKYLVIRYNCWKYDYYEEPLVAIVASIMSIIEEKTKLFPDSKEKSEILGMLKAVGVTFLSIGSAALKNKFGIDIDQLQESYKIVQDGRKEGAISYKEEHDYDVYFSFNQTLGKLSELLRNFAQKYTIVFLVDELDRCMPEYAIKVLERLHHLTEGMTNVITIISIDKERLTSSINQIFGFDDVEKYLRKFIQFAVPLDAGVISERITDKFSEYIELFDREIFPVEDSIEEFMQVIFKGIDIREQERLVNKAMTAHKLLYSDQKDFSFMCVELLIATLISLNVNMKDLSPWFSNFALWKKEGAVANVVPNDLSSFLETKFKETNFDKLTHTGMHTYFEYDLDIKDSLYGAIAYTWCKLFLEDDMIKFSLKKQSKEKTLENNIEELKKFYQMVTFIE